MFGPKHTVKSVAAQITSGLDRRTLVLDRRSWQSAEEEIKEGLETKGLDRGTIDKVLEVVRSAVVKRIAES